MRPNHFTETTRRELIALGLAGTLWRAAARGQNPVPLYRDYSRCLPEYLRELADAAYRRRNDAIAKLTTPQAIAARQRWVRETFWKLTGGEPEKTPLNARTTGSLERPGFRLERVVYESQPGLAVSANLYVPTTGRPPYPGVLFQMGHSANGKAGDVYQRCCQGLVRHGFVVLGFDPMGQGERTYYPGPNRSRTRLESIDEEHTYPGRQMLLKGDTSTRLQTWDTVRSLDYLASLPMVDPKRLASTGQSGGATNTMLLAAVDDRLAAAAISCPNTENVACANFNPPGSTDDAEQNLVASGPLGFDRWDLLYPLAPKPLLVLVSYRDAFGTYSPRYIENGLEEYRKLQGVYQRLGKQEQIGWFGTPLPHGLEYEMRVRIYNWLGRWLIPDWKPVAEEPETEPIAEKDLFASDSGNVVVSFRGETPFSLNRKRAVKKAAKPDLRTLLELDTPPPGPGMTVLADTRFRNSTVRAVEFRPATNVWVPAYVYTARRDDAAKPVIIVVEPGGRALWHEGELYDAMTRQGCAVCAPDVRGIGDMTPEFSRASARHSRSHNSDEHWGWAGLIFGKPMVGQRVSDLLAAISGLRSRPEFRNRRLIVAARGAMTVPAQFAAALDDAVDTLYLSGGLISFRNLVETENYRCPMSNFVPDLLLHTDLPELAASMAPRRVILAGTVDGGGKPMSVEAVRAAFAGANVDVRADSGWGADAILSL